MDFLRRIFNSSTELARDTRVEARDTLRSLERIRARRLAIEQMPTVDFPISGFIRDVPPRKRDKAVQKNVH